MIHVKNLARSFGRTAALRDLSFSVERNAVHALIGPNGSGKTTTLRCLCGDIAPDAGTLDVFGAADPDSAGAEIAAVTEDRLTHRNFTVDDYVSLYASLYPRWNGEEFRSGMQQAGFSGEECVSGLSGGQKTLLLDLLALCSGVGLLILDEPMQHLDPVFRGYISGLIAAYPEQHNGSVIISSHEIYEVEEVATHITIISEGRDIYNAEVDEAKETHRIVPQTESGVSMVIGPVGQEHLVRNTPVQKGRYPNLKEITIGYLSRNS